jgi:1,2-phenylacetyl-CoA epoxidase PaaB subunit
MAKKTVYHWRVYYTKGTPAKLIGSVHAPDEETAREVAVIEYGVSRDKLSRLLAVKVPMSSSFVLRRIEID